MAHRSFCLIFLCENLIKFHNKSIPVQSQKTIKTSFFPAYFEIVTATSKNFVLQLGWLMERHKNQKKKLSNCFGWFNRGFFLFESILFSHKIYINVVFFNKYILMMILHPKIFFIGFKNVGRADQLGTLVLERFFFISGRKLYRF